MAGKVDSELVDRLDEIDSTVGAIGDVVSLMLGDGTGASLPGSAVLHKLQGTLRSELDELARYSGMNG